MQEKLTDFMRYEGDNEANAEEAEDDEAGGADEIDPRWNALKKILNNN